MSLVIICIVSCVLFGGIIIGSVLAKPTFWLQDFAPEVQKRYIETHPDFVVPDKEKGTRLVVVKKLIVSIVFVFLLAFLGYLSGVHTLKGAFINIYIIWAVVNIFDVLVLDLSVFAFWKKIRLPGTEHMDEEYKGNYKKHIKEGIFGLFIGVPICFLAALLVLIY